MEPQNMSETIDMFDLLELVQIVHDTDCKTNEKNIIYKKTTNVHNNIQQSKGTAH